MMMMHFAKKSMKVVIFALITQSAIAAPPPYTLQGLGDLPGGKFESAALDINDSGQVVGESVSGYGSKEAFLWDPKTGMIGLGKLAGYADSRAYGINDRGEVAGFSENGSSVAEAFIWTAADGLVSLGDLPGGPVRSRARAINNAGEVVGSAESAAGRRAFRWDSQQGMIDLGMVNAGDIASLAYDNNNVGQVAGRNDSTTAGAGDGFVWSPLICTMQPMGDLPGGSLDTTARRINDHGQVVGNASSTNGVEAFLWGTLTGTQGLGDLPGSAFESRAFGINDLGQVVGTGKSDAGDRAFLWTASDGMVEVSSLIVDGSASGWVLSGGRQINNRGQIVGFGTNPSGQLEAWLATPTSACAVAP